MIVRRNSSKLMKRCLTNCNMKSKLILSFLRWGTKSVASVEDKQSFLKVSCTKWVSKGSDLGIIWAIASK